MVERYREDAIRAIFFARWEAQQAGSSYIEGKHILLGLTQDADSKANQLFALSAHVEAFRTPLKPYASIQSSTSKDLPFSNASKNPGLYS
jgi:ATP-dependent Clp protease ATP-binding subunit ClpA